MASKFLNISTDTTLGGSSASDDTVSSQKAVKSYIDSQTGTAPSFSNITGQPTDNANLAAAFDAKYDASNPDGYQANVIETVKVNGTALTPTSKAVDVTVPTKTSDLTNDDGFITGITSSDVTTALGYTPADNSDVVDLTSGQTIGGTKTFTNTLIKAGEFSNVGNIGLRINDTNGKGLDLWTAYYVGGGIYARMEAHNNTSNKSAYIDVRSTDAGLRIFSCNGSCDVAYAPASTDTNTIVTTTARSVAASSVKFGFGNGLKIATKEVSLSAATDYSWSYGITFSAAPVILVTRRSGATSTGGIYDAWIRGSVGTSSSKIYSPNAETVELVAIGY